MNFDILRDNYHITLINRYFPLFSDDISIVKLELRMFPERINTLINHEFYFGLGYYSNHNITPLMYACMKGRHDIFDYLLEFGADINIQNQDKYTVLHYAVQTNQKRMIVKIICSRNFKAPTADLLNFYFTHYGSDKEIIYLLLPIVNVNAVDKYGRNCLMNYIFYCEDKLESIDIINFLINWTSNINQQDINGNTVLHWICRSKKLRIGSTICELLCNSGADPHIINNNGYTPLELNENIPRHNNQISTFLTEFIHCKQI